MNYIFSEHLLDFWKLLLKHKDIAKKREYYPFFLQT